MVGQHTSCHNGGNKHNVCGLWSCTRLNTTCIGGTQSISACHSLYNARYSPPKIAADSALETQLTVTGSKSAGTAPAVSSAQRTKFEAQGCVSSSEMSLKGCSKPHSQAPSTGEAEHLPPHIQKARERRCLHPRGAREKLGFWHGSGALWMPAAAEEPLEPIWNSL